MKNQSLTSILRTMVVALSLLFVTSLIKAQSTDDWTLHSEKNGVKLYFKTTTCGDKNLLLLKLENTNVASKNVNYNIIVESDGHNMPLLPQFVALSASETKSGSCDSVTGLASDIKNIVNPRLLVVMTVN